MKNVVHTLPEVEGFDYSGTFTVKVPKRSERCKLQMEAMKASESAKEDPSTYIDFSERVLNENLVEMNIIHIPSGTEIKTRDDLEYVESESLIALICQIVVGGQKLGKKIA